MFGLDRSKHGAEVKTLYGDLRTSMPELPSYCKDFRGFNTSQLNTACEKLTYTGIFSTVNSQTERRKTKLDVSAGKVFLLKVGSV